MNKQVDPMIGFIIAPILFFIFFTGGILLAKYGENKANESPIWRIDYVDNNGSIKYSRYSSKLWYNRGILNYKDYYDNGRISTTETTKATRIR